MSTAKENVLKVYHHEPTEQPVVIGDVNLVLPIPATEAAADPNGAYDMWGVHWTFDPTIMGFMPTPGKVVLDDITEWKEKVTIPDLDSMDFKGYAEEILPTLDLDKATMFFTFPGLLSGCIVCSGWKIRCVRCWRSLKPAENFLPRWQILRSGISKRFLSIFRLTLSG